MRNHAPSEDYPSEGIEMISGDAAQQSFYESTSIYGSLNSLSTTTREDSLQNVNGLSRLTFLCEIASSLPRPGNLPQKGSQMEDVDHTWDAIRAWLATHPSPDDRQLAAQSHGEYLTTALHLACKAYNPPIDVISSLIDCSPDTARWADSFSWIPLHYACANGANLDVLQLLVSTYPESKIAQDKRGRTPLHFALGRSQRDVGDAISSNVMAEIVRLLSDSGAAELSDENGMLPLHYACAYGASAAVLQVLTSVNPESVTATDKRGRTPLHFAMGNGARAASPGVVDLLLCLDDGVGQHLADEKLVNQCDNDGNLALNLLATQANRLPSDAKECRQNTSECLTIYLNHKPQPSADFLTALQSLPDWLRDRAVVNIHVQTILNEKIAKRFPTFILILDGYFLIMIIACFWLASQEYIKYRFENTPLPEEIGKLNALYAGGIYFLLREAMQMLSLWSLGTFKTWFKDPSNWLDVTVITLVLYFAAAMQFNLGNDQIFRSCVALTIGILWNAVISYLKSTLVDFAVFVGGLQYVVRRLAAFLLALSIVIILFAQMFWFIYSGTEKCASETNPPEFSHCSFQYSLLRTYSMLMGEVNMYDYTDYVISAFLYGAFAFLVVILLSNVLIAIVTDSYGVIKNERAAMVFWSNRLDFVAEMDCISTGWHKMCKILIPCYWTEQDPKTPESIHTDDGEKHSSKDYFRNAWNFLMSLYDDYSLNWRQFEFWFFLICRVLNAVVVIPLWIIVGFASAGWLWPPQVRERLLIQRTTALTRADLSNQISQQVSDLRRQVKKLREEVKEEMKTDRKEVVSMKAEAEKVQQEVIADMSQVKEIMSTLLDLRRNELNEC